VPELRQLDGLQLRSRTAVYIFGLEFTPAKSCNGVNFETEALEVWRSPRGGSMGLMRESI
jgi:hypothetical protein